MTADENTTLVECWRRWRDAAADPTVDCAIRCLWQRLDDDVRSRGPTCWTSGKCCRFDSYGHRLYVTGLETAWVLAQVTHPLPVLPSDGCPYQIDGLCSIHAVRPIGCRIFFCQQSAQHWQPDLYERYLTELRDLHTRHNIPYRYLEWRAALAESAAV